MDSSKQKEHFSRAYLHAVAAVVGLGVTPPPDPDDDSVDLNLCRKGGNGTVRSPILGVQSKCTASNVIRDGALRFSISRKNYDDLRPTNLMVPRILVVHCIPGDLQEWLRHSEDDMLLRHCSYWYSLHGKPDIEEQSITVVIPRNQQFNPEALTGIMERIGNGGLP